MTANYGGTDLNTPMVFTLNKYYEFDHDRILNVFVLTDGEFDPNPIFELIKSRKSN